MILYDFLECNMYAIFFEHVKEVTIQWKEERDRELEGC